MDDTSEKLGEEKGISVIGLGHWGQNYVRIFSQLPGARVVSCCEANGDRLSETADTFPGVEAMTDPGDVYSSSEISAVVVASTASTHFDIAMSCLESGKDLRV